MNRFLKGSLRFIGSLGIVYFLQSSVDLDYVFEIFLVYTRPILGHFLTGLFALVILLGTLYILARWFFSGIYFMVASEPLSMYESSSFGNEIMVFNNPEYPNITRVLLYRNSIMKSMNNEHATKQFLETSKLDSLYKVQHGTRTIEVVNYLEGKLSNMDNETGLNFLRSRQD